MKKGSFTPVLHVLGGLVGGAIVSTIIANSIASKRTAATEGASVHEVVARPADSDRDPWLEWRLRRLEDQAAAASADANRPRATRDGGPPTVARFTQADQQAEQERHVREYEDSVRAHDREPIDGPWADKTSRSLSAEMSRIAEAGRFAVTAVDCKTTTCKTVFRWPTYTAALDASGSLLDHAYEANCTHTILLPPPPDPNAPYQATMLFDCEELRARQAR